MIDLKTKFMGLELKNPIIIGSSGLTNSVEKIKNLAKNDAGAIVLKSIFEEQIIMEMEQAGDQNQFDYPEAYDYARHYTKEKSTADYLDLISDSKKAVDIPIIASVNCVNNEEWSSFAKKTEAAGADAIEINVSMLPSDFKFDSTQNEQKYFDIASQVRKEVKIPIALKMSNYSAGLAHLIQKLSWTKNIDAFVLFNRYYSPDIDLENMKIVSSNVFSSQEEISTSLRWIALLSKEIQLPLVASTGIHDSNDVIKQILSGAQVVQIVSTIYQNGERRIGKIIEGLEGWMKNKNYTSLDDFRGTMCNQNTHNAAAYERVQFMKYFSNM